MDDGFRDLLASCDEAAKFPKNLVYHDTYEHNLRAYVERLDEREMQLFSREESASLDLQEYNVKTQSKWMKPVSFELQRLSIADSNQESRSISQHSTKGLKEYFRENLRSDCRYA